MGWVFYSWPLPAGHSKAEIRNSNNQEEENGQKIMVVHIYDARGEQPFGYGAWRHDCHVTAGYADRLKKNHPILLRKIERLTLMNAHLEPSSS